MVYLRRAERRAQIIAGATAFFAQQGLSGQLRDLAKSLDITQPLLYRYFPSKKHLLDTIFEELFFKSWDDSWSELIIDQQIPLAKRIGQFYKAFDQEILNRDWVRLFVFSGLGGQTYNQLIFDQITSQIFRPLCVELRKFFGFGSVNPRQITLQEIEVMLETHGILFYYRQRQHIYSLPVYAEVDHIIRHMIIYMGQTISRLLVMLYPEESIKKRILKL